MELTNDDRISLKSKHPHKKLVVATVTDKQGVKHHFVFEGIDRSLMDLASKQMQNSPTDAMAMQMRATLVFGDVSLIESDDHIFRGLLAKWETIQKPADVELGEL